MTYGGKTFTWIGRRLNTYNNGSTTTSYKYNEDGIRTSKTVGSTKTEFFLDGSTILAQKTGSTTIPFYYDGNGTRIGFKHNGTMYYYVYNLQGDVIHILTPAGNVAGTYKYDAWGKITNLSSLTDVAQANPFRYRGYYYDNESGLYYLNSRYYNAEWGRFINADGYVSTGQGLTSYNMFAYCGNNPIMYVDHTGELSMPSVIKLTQAMVRLSSNVIKSAKSEVFRNKQIDFVENIHESTVTTLIDDFCNVVTPTKSVLTKAPSVFGKAFDVAIDKIGFASIFVSLFDIIWDYNTYGFSEKFVTSACITVSFTCLGVLAGAAIVATGWAPTTMVVASIGAGIMISELEDKYRKFLFGVDSK